MKVLAVLLVGVLIGCATGPFIPKHGLKDPEDMVSIPNLVEIEKRGIEAITTFEMVFNPGLWTEGTFGIWPVLGRGNGQEFKGYAYLSSVHWFSGEILLKTVFPYPESEIKHACFIYFNRDAGWAYSLDGQENDYNPKKFDKDDNYRAEVFEQFGMTLSQLDEFWVNRFSEKSEIQETIVGSSEWKELKKSFNQSLSHYKMPNGVIRSSVLSLDGFRQEAVAMPGFNGGQRFVKNLRVPLIPDPAFALGVSVANAALAASVDKNIEGFYARAIVMRKDLSYLFRQMSSIYKELLAERNKIIVNLLEELDYYGKQMASESFRLKLVPKWDKNSKME